MNGEVESVHDLLLMQKARPFIEGLAFLLICVACTRSRAFGKRNQPDFFTQATKAVPQFLYGCPLLPTPDNPVAMPFP